MRDQLTPNEEGRVREALRAIAEQTPAEGSTAPVSRRLLLIAAAAATLTVASVGAVALSSGHQAKRPLVAAPRPTATATETETETYIAPLGSRVGYDLPMLVKESERVVVGQIVEVRHGTESGPGGMPYVLARIRVEQALAGPNQEPWAFDYDPASGGGGGSEDPAGPAWTIGDRVLLFLAPSTGTVHEGIQPQHWQVTGGPQGRYQIKGDHLEAPFTLDDVRAALAAKN